MSVKTATNRSSCSSPLGGERRGILSPTLPPHFRITGYPCIRISALGILLFQEAQNLFCHGGSLLSYLGLESPVYVFRNVHGEPLQAGAIMPLTDPLFRCLRLCGFWLCRDRDLLAH